MPFGFNFKSNDAGQGDSPNGQQPLAANGHVNGSGHRRRTLTAPMMSVETGTSSVRRYFNKVALLNNAHAVNMKEWPTVSVDRFFMNLSAPSPALDFKPTASASLSEDRKETMDDFFGDFAWE